MGVLSHAVWWGWGWGWSECLMYVPAATAPERIMSSRVRIAPDATAVQLNVNYDHGMAPDAWKPIAATQKLKVLCR